jgi:SAM-dependent methyltransferase
MFTNLIPNKIRNNLINISKWRKALTPIAVRECNICDFKGYFKGFGRPFRLDAKCPSCGSLERHRLLMLAISRGEIKGLLSSDCYFLHFAAEKNLEQIFRDKFKYYQTADLYAKADIVLDLENINIGDERYDVILANHVLEHVDDEKASAELSRILRPKGILICQVPIVEGWPTTYENKSITSESDRWLHFGQGDHVRYFGADFRERICKGGFTLIKEYTSQGTDVIKYGLLRGEKVFVFEKQ